MSKIVEALKAYVPTLAHETQMRLSAIGERFDGWENQLTGFGTTRDKSTYGYVGAFVRIPDQELANLYHSDDIAARIVNIVPDEMLREGFEVKIGDPAAETIIAEKFDSLGANAKLADGIRWGRLYGGAALLIGADDGRDASLPLIPERAKDISYLYVIERRVLWPATYYTQAGHPKLGLPETYFVTPVVAGGGTQTGTVIVHESRLILFGGAKTSAFEKLTLAGWDISVLQRPYEILRQFNTGWKAVETLLTDGNQAVFKMTGLAEMMRAGQETLVRRRMNVMEMFRSAMRALVIDADSQESYERHGVAFGSIPETLDKLCLRMSASAELPVTILMGQSPAGMNATGESDFRWHYDRLRAKQKTELAPPVRRLTLIWLQTEAGRAAVKKKPDAITVTFPPLWTETPLNEAIRRKTIAEADSAYQLAGVFLSEEIALARSRPEGFNDDAIPMTDEMRATREAIVTDKAADEDTSALPEETELVPVVVPQTLKLTASDLAAIATVNEARASVSLPPLPGPDGDLTLPEFKAKHATVIAAAVTAETPAAPVGGGFP